jgi:hypothetical protein
VRLEDADFEEARGLDIDICVVREEIAKALKAEVVEDEYQPSGDLEQDMLDALSLLETAKQAMTLLGLCITFQRSPNAEQDQYLTATMNDIKQFLSAFEEKPEAWRKAPKHKLSAKCVQGKHSKCAKVDCNCFCHADEWQESEL